MSETLLEEARAAIARRLSPESAAHCERVAAAAREMAVRLGVDPGEAELAGLLHDWSRDEGDASLLADAAEEGIALTDADREKPYLLHARVGAAQVRRALPGLSDEVARAVAAHTLGDDPMSDLAMLVYVADMIEPARDFPGVGRLRDLAAEAPLREAFAAAFARTLEHVRARGRTVHPRAAVVEAALAREKVAEVAR